MLTFTIFFTTASLDPHRLAAHDHLTSPSHLTLSRHGCHATAITPRLSRHVDITRHPTHISHHEHNVRSLLPRALAHAMSEFRTHADQPPATRAHVLHVLTAAAFQERTDPQTRENEAEEQ